MDSASGEPFYVVRKGDVIGIYKNLADCQAQVSNSVNIFFSASFYHFL
jgi:viroplasmin and RNaseH domain-containing protein